MNHDRMHTQVRFQKCERGYLLSAGGHEQYGGGMGVLYAFDTIDAVAAWFIDQYRPDETLDAVISELESA